jgi:hypothetical protein
MHAMQKNNIFYWLLSLKLTDGFFNTWYILHDNTEFQL